MAANGIVLSSQNRINEEKTELFLSKASELQKSAPQFEKSSLVVGLVCAVLRPLLTGFLKLGFNFQAEQTPLERQHHNAKKVRLLCETFDLPDTPEILSAAQKCEGTCGNHTFMLVRAEKSLCWDCWGESLKALG